MVNLDRIAYATENTHLIHAPSIQVSPLGGVIFNFSAVSEDMDRVGVINVRDGQVEVFRPQQVSLADAPKELQEAVLLGFGPAAQVFAENMHRITMTNVNFTVHKMSMRMHTITRRIEEAVDAVMGLVKERDNPADLVITTIDDGWEVGVLKTVIDQAVASLMKGEREHD